MTIPKPGKPFHNHARFWLAGFLVLAAGVRAIQFPDSAELAKEYHTSARRDGKPSDFFRKQSGDSSSVHVEWKDAKPISFRYEQTGEFDPDSFAVLTTSFGGGAAWHELSLSSSDTAARRLYPGLEQQWILKGYGGETGWLGSGLLHGRFFLVFRSDSPLAPIPITEPLRLGRALFQTLDTSSQWLHVTCHDTRKRSPPVCFSPTDDSRLLIRIDRKSPLILDLWLEEEESASLLEIRQALGSVPENSRKEYSEDLAKMLLGESQAFLVKIAQRIPVLFNWPSWQLQDFKAGRLPAANYLDLVQGSRSPGDSLPAFRYEAKGSVRMSVDLFFRGAIHLRAEQL